MTIKAPKVTVKAGRRPGGISVSLPHIAKIGDPAAKASGQAAARSSRNTQGLLNVAGKVYNAIDYAQEEDDRNFARDLSNQYQENRAKFMAGQSTLQGRDAVKLDRDIKDADGRTIHSADGMSVAERVDKYNTDMAAKAGEVLENDRQRALFFASYDPAAINSYKASEQHLAQQRTIFTRNTLVAETKVEIQAAVINRNDPDQVSEKLDYIEGNTRALHASESDASIDLRVQENKTLVHTGIIRAHISAGTPGKAYAYFEKLKSEGRATKEMTPEAIESVEKEIEQSNIQKIAVAAVDTVLQTIPDTEEGYRTKRSAKLREVFSDNPKAADAAVHRLNVRQSEQDAQARVTRERLNDSITKGIIDAKTYAQAEAQVMNSFRDKHYPGSGTDLKNQLTLAKSRFSGKIKTTDHVAMSEVMRMVDDKEIRNEAHLIGLVGNKATPKDVEGILKYYREGGFMKDWTESRFRTLYAQEMHIKKSDIDEEHYASMREEIKNRYINSKADLSDDGMTSALRDAMIRDKEEGEVRGGLFSFGYGRDMTRAEARSEGESDNFLSTENILGYRRQLRSLGLKGNDSEVYKLSGYAKGIPPVGYASMRDFQEKTISELNKHGIKSNPAMLQAVWMLKNRMITEDQLLNLARRNR